MDEEFFMIFEWTPRYAVKGDEKLNLQIANGTFPGYNNTTAIEIPAAEKKPFIVRVRRDVFKPTSVALSVASESELLEFPARPLRRIVSTVIRGATVPHKIFQTPNESGINVVVSIDENDHNTVMIPNSFNIVIIEKIKRGYKEISIINKIEHEKGASARIKFVPYDTDSHLELEAYGEIGVFRSLPIDIEEK